MNPPICWYGGKTTHAQWILRVMNRYRFNSYIEPFGGSGAVLFSKSKSPNEVYNDLHGDIVNMYEVIRDPKTFRKFKRFVTLTPYSRQAYNRSLQELDRNIDRVERAGHFFVCARQGFGGTGVKEPGWAYSVVPKSKQVDTYLNTIERLGDIHNRLRTVQIENTDAIDCIERYSFCNAHGCSMVYADPPYVFVTRKKINTYQNEFESVQHCKFIDVLLKTPGHKLVSGYESELYQPLLDAGWTMERKKTFCHTARKGKQERTECLYCSPIPVFMND